MSDPYRSQGTRDIYPDPKLALQPANLIAIPWTSNARHHRMDRFSWINLRNLITDGPDGKVAITFFSNSVSYVYPSFWDLQKDLIRMWRESFDGMK